MDNERDCGLKPWRDRRESHESLAGATWARKVGAYADMDFWARARAQRKLRPLFCSALLPWSPPGWNITKELQYLKSEYCYHFSNYAWVFRENRINPYWCYKIYRWKYQLNATNLVHDKLSIECVLLNKSSCLGSVCCSEAHGCAFTQSKRC